MSDNYTLHRSGPREEELLSDFRVLCFSKPEDDSLKNVFVPVKKKKKTGTRINRSAGRLRKKIAPHR